MDQNVSVQQETKFCKECGQKIAKKAVICPHCGCQVEDTLSTATPQIVINNSNQNQNVNTNAAPLGARLRRKWISFFLCLFLGYCGAHKFYEGNFGMGILFLFTFGLFGFGWFFNTLSLLGKPDPYFVL